MKPLLLQDTKPTTIYHYTSQDGLIGIIGQKCLWATKVHYMNDTKEYSLAFDLFAEEIERIMQKANNEILIKDCKEIMEGLNIVRCPNVCVCSFSKRKDLLSQWRGYCGNKQGFAIGFKYDVLENLSKNTGINLNECIYDTAMQKGFVSGIIESTVKCLEEEANKAHPGYAQWMLMNLACIAPTLKHNAFKEEEEIRLITQLQSCTDPQYQFRTNGKFIMPYYNIDFSSYIPEGIITEIVIGPGSDQELTKNTIDSMLTKHEYREVSVSSSSIPYRNW